jgi:hypothetical protein
MIAFWVRSVITLHRPDMMKTLRFAVLVLTVAAGSARAQASVSNAEQEVMAVIRRVFDGMKEADSAKVRTAFAPGARMVRVGTRANPDTLVYDTPDGWLAAVARSNKTWDERVTNVRIQVDGHMASAWMDYTFLLNGTLSHCGVDSMDFMKVKGEWKITQLGDTQRRTGC